MEELSSRAAAHGIVVDALTYSSSGDFAAALGTLAHGTGGFHVAHAAAGSALAANLRQSMRRSVGMSCTLEVRCSSGLAVVGVVGPVAPLSELGRLVVDGGDDDVDIELPRRLQAPGAWSYLCNPPEAHQGMGILLQCTPGTAGLRHLHLQVALVWTLANGATVYRVVNKTLTCGTSDDAALATDMAVAATLLAKVVASQALLKNAARDRMQAEILRRALGKLT